MARSSSVRRWLEELRFETESYDPQLNLNQQQSENSVAWRYARVTWSPDTQTSFTGNAGTHNNNNIINSQPEMDSNDNKVVNSLVKICVNDCDSENLEEVEDGNNPEQIRNRFATVSVPRNTVSNTVKIFNNTPPPQKQNSLKINKQLNDEIVLRKPQNLQIPGVVIQRPLSHQPLKQTSYLHRENQQYNQTLTVIKEGPIGRVKLSLTNKSPKHWKTGVHALLTDRALFFFDDADALLAMKSGAASGGVCPKDRVDLCDGARIFQDVDKLHSTKRNVLAICNKDGNTIVLMQNDDQENSDTWFKYISNVIAKHAPNFNLHTGTNISNSTKSALNWFFKKRPNKETLVNKGIYKNEPIFGNTLERLYDSSNKKRLVPAFVDRCTEILENPPHVLSTGIYRTSGNLSHIQKLRLRVDQEDAEALEDPSLISDSDVLAGALKLFFRELQIPLVPYQIYLRLSEACANTEPEKRFHQSKEALKKLPEPHYHTLAVLCRHLLRITVHERQNQMSAANLGIVWGPSFTWPDEGTGTRALHLCTDINRIVQYLIEDSGKLFHYK